MNFPDKKTRVAARVMEASGNLHFHWLSFRISAVEICFAFVKLLRKRDTFRVEFTTDVQRV